MKASLSHRSGTPTSSRTISAKQGVSPVSSSASNLRSNTTTKINVGTTPSVKQIHPYGSMLKQNASSQPHMTSASTKVSSTPTAGLTSL